MLLPTYHGARRQPNLMPLVALLLARAGVPVLIHGRHDFASRVSPFALLEALGIAPSATPAPGRFGGEPPVGGAALGRP